jgi:hypothetical protein
MGLFSKKEKKLLPMEKIRYIEKMKKGWTTNVKLPEVESVSHGMATKGVATAAFGIIGLAMTMGSSNKQRKIRAKIRFPENGIVIENGTTDGKDIKIPWKAIINAHNVGQNIYINLNEGEKIHFLSYANIRHVESTSNFITSYINSRASGQVEEGW